MEGAPQQLLSPSCSAVYGKPLWYLVSRVHPAFEYLKGAYKQEREQLFAGVDSDGTGPVVLN